MSSASKPSKNGLLILIGAIIAVFSVLFITNRDHGPSLLEQEKAAQQNKDQKPTEVQHEQGQTLTTPSATPSPTATVQGIATRSISLFIDKNGNASKDASEKQCDTCVAKVVVAANMNSGIFWPSANKLGKATVHANGGLTESDLLSSNAVWAFWDDRKILVPEQVISLSDSTAPVTIAAIDITASVAGVNANIGRITENTTVTNGKFSVIYGFTLLVPAMNNAASQGKEIWIMYTPDPADSDRYYLAKGLLHHDTLGTYSGSSEGYYMQIDWKLQGSLPAALKQENVHFIVP